MSAFRRIRTTNREIGQLQQNVHDAIQPVLASSLVRGVLISDVSLTASVDNIIQHQLKKPLTGCVVVKQSADARVWTNQANNAEPSTYVYVQCSADVVVSLWCF